MRERAFVALGSNVGDRERHLATGRAGLTQLPGTTILAATAIEETAPVGGPPQGRYLNQMVLLETALTPRALLEQCQRIERAAGRVRSERWGPRTLDLDLVRHGASVINEPDLVVPHPEIANREFWQREIAALEHAVAQLTNRVPTGVRPSERR